MFRQLMSSQPVYPSSVAEARSSGPRLVFSSSQPRRWSRWLDHAIFFFFFLFALALPHSVKGAHHAYEAALLAWAIKLVVERRRPFPMPLVAPMLAFLALSGISSALSPTPFLSWERMRIVTLLFIAVLLAQTLTSMRQIKWIAAVLLFSATVSAGITGWQYLGGYGVELLWFPADSPLALTGVQPGDVVQKLNGRGVHSPEALRDAIAKLLPEAPVRMRVAHSTPIQRLDVTVTRASLVGAGLLLPGRLARGHPLRPQGFFIHYAIYVEVMLQLGLLAWGLFLASRRRSGWTRWLLGTVFLALLAVVISTQTRSAVAAMLLGCFVALVLATTRKERTVGLVLLGCVLLFATYWIYHTRGFHWVDKRDPGTEFRVMMWQDALRIIPSHPWFGIGMNSLLVHWREYDIRAFRVFPVRWHFHSTYLQIAVERGLVTLAAWLWLAGAYLIFLFKLLPRARAAGWFPYGLALGALGGWLAFLASGIVQYNLGEEQVSVMIWTVVGLSLALARVIGRAGDRQMG